jgi:hypothetical protein
LFAGFKPCGEDCFIGKLTGNKPDFDVGGIGEAVAGAVDALFV